MLAALITSLALAQPAPPPDAAPAPTPCHALGPKERVRIDLDEVPLATFARMVSCALARNILLDPPQVGDKRVSVIGPNPIGARDLDVLWQAVLSEHGLISERHGAFEVVRPPP